MAGSNAEARVYREIVRLAHSGIDSPTLRLEVMHRLRKVIPVDAFWVATADPATLLFTSAVKEAIPDTAVPRFVQNEFLEDDFNKFRVLAMSTGAPVSSLYRASENRPETSRRYREILTPLGFGDELRAAFRAGGSVWGFACMHRESGDRGYTSKDAGLLAAVAPHLAQGLRTALLFEHSRRREWPDHEEGPGLVMLADDFSISATTPAGERWIAELGDGAGRLALPEAVQSVVARLWARERSAKDELVGCLLPQTQVRTVSGRWLVIHASRLSGPGAAGQTAVMLEPARAAEIAPLLLNAYGLTRRETEVTLLTLRGVAIDGIAAALSISRLTVQQHLKTVFDKTESAAGGSSSPGFSPSNTARSASVGHRNDLRPSRFLLPDRDPLASISALHHCGDPRLSRARHPRRGRVRRLLRPAGLDCPRHLSDAADWCGALYQRQSEPRRARGPGQPLGYRRLWSDRSAGRLSARL